MNAAKGSCRVGGRLLLLIASLACAAASAADDPSFTDAQVAAKLGISIDRVVRLRETRGLSNAELHGLSKERVARLLFRLDHPRPDRPYEAAEFRRLQLQDETGRIPADALGKAVEHVKALRSVNRIAPAPPGGGILPPPTVAGMPIGPIAPPPGNVAAAPSALAGEVIDLSQTQAGMLELESEPLPSAERGVAPAPAGPGGITPASWKWVGPGNIGGRTRSIVIHPTNPNVIWVGAVAGGVWKTVDGGGSWAPLADFMANLNVSCMALFKGDRTTPLTLYAGTGEGFYNLDAFRGNGIFKSTDGGANWTQLPSTVGPNFHYVNRIAVSNDGKTILAATQTGLFRSTNSGTSFTALPAPVNVEILDVDMLADSNRVCIAGGRGGRAFFSVDGGATWTASTGIPAVPGGFGGRVELTFARKRDAGNKIVAYASVDRNQGSVYRSNDGGKTWTLRNETSLYLSSQGWYDNTIWADDPLNNNLVIVGGVDLYRSSTGGTTFAKISQWYSAPLSAHADHHAIVSHPQYDGVRNRTVFFGNDGGIYKATNVATVVGTTGWQSLNRNYGVTQFYGAAANINSGRIVGGTQDNGTLRYIPPSGSGTGPQAYTEMFGGDGGWCAADPTDPNFFYGEYVYLQIHRSTDAGTSSTYIHNATSPGGLADAVPGGANFIAPFVLDPNNPNTMLAGGRRLWRSINVKASTPAWTAIKPQHPATGAPSNISAIAVRRTPGAPVGSRTVWVGHNNGDVFRSLNATLTSPTWTQADTGLPNGRICNRVVIDTADPNRVYACFGGYSSGNLWRTTNNGTAWTNIAASLPAVPIFDLAIHPDNPNFLYAATEVGVFASADQGATWQPTNQGPANVAVFEMFWMKNVLVAVTHGRGIFWIDLSLPPVIGVAPVAPAPTAPLEPGKYATGEDQASAAADAQFEAAKKSNDPR
ncbi:MAG: hypothetical protein SFX72_09630 [Isosphaeraceae bacterium]|nr:hypothetical protein [Isosphaeraceae bacterium]